MRGRKISKFRFSGSIFNAEKHDKTFFRNSNFSDFLGIKPEIHHYVIWSQGGTTKFQPGQDLKAYFHILESDFDLHLQYLHTDAL